jgi:putative restriction endonuclease
MGSLDFLTLNKKANRFAKSIITKDGVVWTYGEECIASKYGIKVFYIPLILVERLYRYMPDRIFGHIPGYPEGSVFDSRIELSIAGVHRPRQAGISGSGTEGADSIVLSGGYEDDQDFGDIIVYTGHGGRDPETGHQVSDQLLTRGNLALAYSRIHGLPVRVIRGASHTSPYSPPFGYRYDGLYRVEDYWRERGRSGRIIWRFRLIKIAKEQPGRQHIAEQSESYLPTLRQETTVLRIIRDTQQAKLVKELYNYQCQICGIQLQGSAGLYAEAAHIRPLGTPHNGPDTPDNLLCLCPNHHVLFDYGGIAIADDFSLLGTEGRLMVKPEHHINIEHIRYHRMHYYKGP